VKKWNEIRKTCGEAALSYGPGAAFSLKNDQMQKNTVKKRVIDRKN
jgi:hypothetical protein